MSAATSLARNSQSLPHVYWKAMWAHSHVINMQGTWIWVSNSRCLASSRALSAATSLVRNSQILLVSLPACDCASMPVHLSTINMQRTWIWASRSRCLASSCALSAATSLVRNSQILLVSLPTCDCASMPVHLSAINMQRTWIWASRSRCLASSCALSAATSLVRNSQILLVSLPACDCASMQVHLSAINMQRTWIWASRSRCLASSCALAAATSLVRNSQILLVSLPACDCASMPVHLSAINMQRTWIWASRSRCLASSRALSAATSLVRTSQSRPDAQLSL